MSETITLNGREVNYELVRKTVKNINLRIRADCSVSVSANDSVQISVIEEFLQKKADYVLAAIDKFAAQSKYTIADHSYVTGESFRYLGKELRLKLAQGNNEVTTDGVYLYLIVIDPNNCNVKADQIAKWYDQRCREIFSQFITELYPIFRKYGVIEPKLMIRDMSSRWGSCQPKLGIITLNRRLIEFPRNCIEYVVMHELIHFLCPNHSKKFYDLLSTLMPDWRERKDTLEGSEWAQLVNRNY